MATNLGRIAVALLGLGLWSGCGIVDSNPVDNQAASSVKDYYANLEQVGAKYAYTYTSVSTTTGSAPRVSNDTLKMNMEGLDGPVSSWGTRYHCLWTLVNSHHSFEWYYAMSDTIGVDLGGASGTDATAVVELKAPLAVGASWVYLQPGDTVTANITGTGTAVINGKTFPDVIQVHYKGKYVTATKWFAKGMGMIYHNEVTFDPGVTYNVTEMLVMYSPQ